MALARVNHSCLPNCEVVREGRERRLVVVRAVEVGEELCHSYLHTTLPRDARRQELLTR